MSNTALLESVNATLINVGWKLLGALVLWVVGRMLIRFAMRLLGGGMRAQGVEATIIRYVRILAISITHSCLISITCSCDPNQCRRSEATLLF